jgi:hypothetical protein
MPNVPGGYQPDTKTPSARRADFDLLRRISVLDRVIGELEDRIVDQQAQIDTQQTRIDGLEARIVVLETP